MLLQPLKIILLAMPEIFGKTILVLLPMFTEFKKTNITNDFIIMKHISQEYLAKGLFRSLCTTKVKDFYSYNYRTRFFKYSFYKLS